MKNIKLILKIFIFHAFGLFRVGLSNVTVLSTRVRVYQCMCTVSHAGQFACTSHVASMWKISLVVVSSSVLRCLWQKQWERLRSSAAAAAAMLLCILLWLCSLFVCFSCSRVSPFIINSIG